MAWIAPRTWVTGELVTASIMNIHVRDNELHLRAQPVGGRASGFQGTMTVNGANQSFGELAPGAIDFDANTNTQWRMFSAFNITAVNGCTSLVYTPVRRRILDSAGNAGGDTDIGGWSMGAPTTGWKWNDSGWFSSAFSGAWMFRPAYRFDFATAAPTIEDGHAVLMCRGN
jgi:hypothetical protein